MKQKKINKGAVFPVASVVAVLCVAGCDQKLVHHAEVSHAEDEASVLVSAYPAVAWSDIADKLSPKNSLTMDQARAYATVTTQAQVAQVVNAMAAGLGISGPTATRNVTKTTAADGTEQTTGTATQSYGTVPSSSGIPSNSLSTLTPDLTKGPMTYQVDGNTLINEASALFQQAQILDNQISAAYFPKEYRVHLITLQVNVQPKQRDVGYDVYMDVSLLPSNWSLAKTAAQDVSTDLGGQPPVVVYPLILMDAMELTSVGKSLQTIRQAALQLSGVIGQYGANLGLSSGSNKLNSIIGLDKNSLVTVGRINSNTLRIRLGAENSGSAGLALVPRAYNISLVVMTKLGGTSNGTLADINSLQVVTHASFLSTETGKALGHARTREILALEVNKKVCDYEYRVNLPGCAAVHKAPSEQQCFESNNMPAKLNRTFVEANLNLLRAIDRQDYQLVQSCLLDAAGKPLDDRLKKVQGELSLRRLLAALTELQFDSL